MIAPGLYPKAQADADRTRKWSQPYYQQWAARVKAEMAAERMAGFPDDEMLNDLSEGEDDFDEKANLRQHAPTPLSMPASPIMASIPRPVNPGLTIQTSFIGDCFSGEDGEAISPVGLDVDLMAEFRQCLHRQAGHKHLTHPRHNNKASKKSPALTRSRVSAVSHLYHLPSTGSSSETVADKDALASSHRYRFSKSIAISGSPVLRKVNRGRINKKHHRRH